MYGAGMGEGSGWLWSDAWGTGGVHGLIGAARAHPRVLKDPALKGRDPALRRGA